MNQKGFTVIELMIVMSLLLVLSSVALPKICRLNSMNIKPFQRELAYHIQHVHELSMYNQKNMMIQFYSSQYVIRTSPLEKPLYVVKIPKGIKVSTNLLYNEIIFNENGIPNVGGTIYIHTVNQNRRITIIPGTGAVKYYTN